VQVNGKIFRKTVMHSMQVITEKHFIEQ
jgi:hypothetical protein